MRNRDHASIGRCVRGCKLRRSISLFFRTVSQQKQTSETSLLDQVPCRKMMEKTNGIRRVPPPPGRMPQNS